MQQLFLHLGKSEERDQVVNSLMAGKTAVTSSVSLIKPLTPPSVIENVNIKSKMASACCALEWAPDSLYNTAISTIVTYYSTHRKDLKTLPENVQFDIHYKVSTTNEKTWNRKKADFWSPRFLTDQIFYLF